MGFYESEWRIYDESMLLYVLALGSPTTRSPDAAWRGLHRDVARGARIGATST